MAMLRAALYCRLSKDDMLQGDSREYQNAESYADAVRKGAGISGGRNLCGRWVQRLKF